ncbi:MAG: hypothetical protein ACE5IL_15460 [Myxococcota bacterium]
MREPAVLFATTFKGCAANVGPLIGLELEVGETEIVSSSDPPEGVLSVLPVAAEIDDEPVGTLTLSVPTQELATLGRRMLGDDEPDKERALTSDDLDACGEVLNLMIGAVDSAFREHLNQALRCRPLAWWRTDDPGECAFAAEESGLASAALGIPGGGAVHLTLRFPVGLLEQGADLRSTRVQGRFLLLGLEAGTVETLAAVMESARLSVESLPFEAEEFDEKIDEADVILLPGDTDEDLGRVRTIRTSNDHWTSRCIVCMKEPTRERVLRALEDGATHVLRVPAMEIDLLRVLQSARE